MLGPCEGNVFEAFLGDPSVLQKGEARARALRRESFGAFQVNVLVDVRFSRVAVGHPSVLQVGGARTLRRQRVATLQFSFLRPR